jgi:spore photoproduct lyase
MNDIMHKAYFETMHQIQYKDTLFEKTFDWKKAEREDDLEKITIEKINERPGIARKDLWLEIVKNNFMKWTSSFFHEKVKTLIYEEPKRIKFVSSTNRLNEDSKLFIIPFDKNIFIKERAAPYDIRNRPKIHYKNYQLITGTRKTLVERVNDGSIITRFDKTPLPENTTDVVCPHFLELKWAYGCPYDCSWCYLKGTFRFRPNGKKPVIKDLDKIMLHTRTFLDDVETPEILNTGELADSLMSENTHNPFSKLIIPLFEAQNKHKVLFLTKSSNVENLLEIEPHNQVIISFSLNAIPVASKWEKAPKIIKRLEAAQKLHDVGYEVRARIDPMVPIENWEKHYVHLVDLIFERFTPERITLGSLRGLQSTINGCTDKSWVKYLSESSNWGRKIDLATRQQMYLSVIEHLNSQYQYKNVALCKETIQMWNIIDKDYKKIKCNCVW